MSDTLPAESVVSRPRIRCIQEFRAVAVLLVVVCHAVSASFKVTHLNSSRTLGLLMVFGNTGLDMFFLISGFVIYQVARRNIGSARGAGVFLYRRLTRIYPAYWFYTLLVYAIYVSKPQLVNTASGHNMSLWKSLLLWPQHVEPLVLQGWTLAYEMTFYVNFALLLVFAKSRRWVNAGLLAWSVVLLWRVAGILLHWRMPQPGIFVDVEVSPLCLEFLAGCLIARLAESGLPAWLPKVLLPLSLLSLAAVLAVCWQRSDTYFFIDPVSRVLAFLPIYGALILGVLAHELSGRHHTRPLLEAIGDWSYSIYLSHVLVVNAIWRVGQRWIFAGGPHMGTLAMIAISVPVSVAVGYLSYRFLETPMLRHFSRTSKWAW
jgi:peptidoglycan/LPS O-acetylase OafA/YrhL